MSCLVNRSIFENEPERDGFFFIEAVVFRRSSGLDTKLLVTTLDLSTYELKTGLDFRLNELLLRLLLGLEQLLRLTLSLLLLLELVVKPRVPEPLSF